MQNVCVKHSAYFPECTCAIGIPQLVAMQNEQLTKINIDKEMNIGLAHLDIERIADNL